jgi:hypothetical protein
MIAQMFMQGMLKYYNLILSPPFEGGVSSASSADDRVVDSIISSYLYFNE